MKEAIERLKMLSDVADRYNWIEESKVEIKISDVRSLIDFYERHKCKDEQPNTPDITPEWDKIPERFRWVAIDANGTEFCFWAKPHIIDMVGVWHSEYLSGTTGRDLGMDGINWRQTLSKRPAKQ